MSSALLAIVAVALIMALVGYALSRLSDPIPADDSPSSDQTEGTTNTEPNTAQIIEAVNQRLPQTQCAQCGYPGCRPYAQAIVNDNAPINQCPPGGTELINELAEYLAVEPLALDPERGLTKPEQLAYIVEDDCIGCVLCINACPVDAIVGAARQMHTVISDQCTGCELCLPPCPVDCIELHPVDQPLHRWQWPKPA